MGQFREHKTQRFDKDFIWQKERKFLQLDSYLLERSPLKAKHETGLSTISNISFPDMVKAMDSGQSTQQQNFIIKMGVVKMSADFVNGEEFWCGPLGFVCISKFLGRYMAELFKHRPLIEIGGVPAAAVVWYFSEISKSLWTTTPRGAVDQELKL